MSRFAGVGFCRGSVCGTPLRKTAGDSLCSRSRDGVVPIIQRDAVGWGGWKMRPNLVTISSRSRVVLVAWCTHDFNQMHPATSLYSRLYLNTPCNPLRHRRQCQQLPVGMWCDTVDMWCGVVWFMAWDDRGGSAILGSGRHAGSRSVWVAALLIRIQYH